MATYNDGKGYNLGTGTAHVAAGINNVSSITVDLDFAAITTARAAAGLTALAATDVLEVVKIPANTLVLGVDPDGYLDGVNANTAAAYSLNAAAGTPTGYAGGKFYTAADTIDVTTVNAADTAVMSLTVVMVDCS
jgi:hypothetical protein